MSLLFTRFFRVLKNCYTLIFYLKNILLKFFLTWSWCISCGLHSPLDTCNRPLPFESLTEFCTWPNELEPCRDVIDDFGRSQSFWPEKIVGKFENLKNTLLPLWRINTLLPDLKIKFVCLLNLCWPRGIVFTQYIENNHKKKNILTYMCESY